MKLRTVCPRCEKKVLAKRDGTPTKHKIGKVVCDEDTNPKLTIRPVWIESAIFAQDSINEMAHRAIKAIEDYYPDKMAVLKQEVVFEDWNDGMVTWEVPHKVIFHIGRYYERPKPILDHKHRMHKVTVEISRWNFREVTITVH